MRAIDFVDRLREQLWVGLGVQNNHGKQTVTKPGARNEGMAQWRSKNHATSNASPMPERRRAAARARSFGK